MTKTARATRFPELRQRDIRKNEIKNKKGDVDFLDSKEQEKILTKIALHVGLDEDRAKKNKIRPYCIACQNEIASIFEDSIQTYNSVICTVSGNYGSTVFDPVSESEGILIFILCDACLVTRKGIYRSRGNKRPIDFDPCE